MLAFEVEKVGSRILSAAQGDSPTLLYVLYIIIWVRRWDHDM